MIRSREGTTQGDPIAMPLYALGVLPLLRSVATGTVQAWLADDSSRWVLARSHRRFTGIVMVDMSKALFILFILFITTSQDSAETPANVTRVGDCQPRR